MNNISAIIIDDEASNRSLLRSLVGQLDDRFTIIGEASNINDGQALINDLKPDVVFLDIRMPEGSGFDLLKRFERINFEVVFVSAFDEYALKAFDYNALDYVLKPIDVAKFSETLKKVHDRVTNHFNYFDNLQRIIETYDAQEAIITKIPVHHNDRVVLLPVNDIMYIQAQDGCTCFYRVNEGKYVSSKQLSDFDFIFNNFPNFIKINRGSYINLNYIHSYSKGMDCFVTMHDGTVHEISRRKKTQVLEAIHKPKPVK